MQKLSLKTQINRDLLFPAINPEENLRFTVWHTVHGFLAKSATEYFDINIVRFIERETLQKTMRSRKIRGFFD